MSVQELENLLGSKLQPSLVNRMLTNLNMLIRWLDSPEQTQRFFSKQEVQTLRPLAVALAEAQPTTEQDPIQAKFEAFEQANVGDAAKLAKAQILKQALALRSQMEQNTIGTIGYGIPPALDLYNCLLAGFDSKTLMGTKKFGQTLYVANAVLLLRELQPATTVTVQSSRFELQAALQEALLEDFVKQKDTILTELEAEGINLRDVNVSLRGLKELQKNIRIANNTDKVLSCHLLADVVFGTKYLKDEATIRANFDQYFFGGSSNLDSKDLTEASIFNTGVGKIPLSDLQCILQVGKGHKVKVQIKTNPSGGTHRTDRNNWVVDSRANDIKELNLRPEIVNFRPLLAYLKSRSTTKALELKDIKDFTKREIRKSINPRVNEKQRALKQQYEALHQELKRLV